MIHDFRYALRMLTKSPGFTVVVVLTLALGIGANSTILSWISSTLLNPIPGVTHTANLVTVMRGEPTDHPSPPFSYPDFRDLRDRSRSFAGLLGYHDDFMSLTGAGKPERIYGALTSINYFDVLGLRPIIGRGFLPDEEQQRTGAMVAVISYSVWQNHFGLDPVGCGQDDSNQSSFVHDHRSYAAGIPRLQDGAPHGYLDSADDGPSCVGFEPSR